MSLGSRIVVYKALVKVFFNGAYSNIVFNNEIKKVRLSSLDTSFAAALFYGVIEKKMTLDYFISLYSNVKLKKISDDVLVILRMGVYQIVFMDKVPDSAAVNESVKLIKNKKSVRGFVNAVLRAIVRNKNGLSYKNRSIKYSCPEWLITLFSKSYGEGVTQKILDSLSGRPNLIVRVNTTKTDKQKLIKSFEENGVCAEDVDKNFDALKLRCTKGIEKLEEFKRGEFHVQDLSSQICCSVLSPDVEDTVVDVCAAPGGKTFTIAEMMKGNGTVLAFDLYESKVNLIKAGAKRLGLSNIFAEKRDGSVSYERESFADKVLCDVPCSGLGIIRRKPEIKYREKDWFQSLPELQLKILSNAARMVKVSGIVVYSTCTLNPEENKGVIEKFLELNKDFCPEEIVLPENFVREVCEPSSQFTIIPGTNNSDGFFIARLKRLR